jgi:hypothetical protein
MHAQLVHFDGPRSAELVAAADRAGRERIEPAIAADPQLQTSHVATYVLGHPDGGQVVVILADDEAALHHANDVISATTLLPGEDPALLPGPDRVDVYQVLHSSGRGAVPVGDPS